MQVGSADPQGLGGLGYISLVFLQFPDNKFFLKPDLGFFEILFPKEARFIGVQAFGSGFFREMTRQVIGRNSFTTPGAIITNRSIRFFSSRTLPGQSYSLNKS